MVTSTAFSVDTSEIVKMSHNFANGPRIAQRELARGMKRATEVTRAITRQGMPRKSGQMQAQMPIKMLQAANNITGEIRATAKSPTGFPYPWVSNYGHGVIRPVNKRVLRFRAADGTIVFTKIVRAVPGKLWAEKGLENSQAAINKEIDVALDAITRALTGTGV